MGIRSDKPLYQVLEKHLRAAESPLTCVQLMDNMEIRKIAVEEFGSDVRLATNKLSDSLGFMWRRGLLTRYPAAQDSRSLARFSYIWDSSKDIKKTEPTPPPVRSSRKTGFVVSEHENGIMIEFEKFIVLVRPK